MSSPEDNNPFDQTIWDPNGEHAIEDPMHGPSAVFDLLQTPPMPLGDGTYYQPGGYYAFGTVYVDANNQPIHRIGMPRSTLATMREAHELQEWREAQDQGEDAVTALEAGRQQERLDRNGVAHAFRASDVCAGGQRIDTCETARDMVAGAKEYADRLAGENSSDKGRAMNIPAWLSRRCGRCALSCEVAVQTNDGRPTGIIRFSNARPLSDDIPTIRIELGAYDGLGNVSFALRPPQPEV